MAHELQHRGPDVAAYEAISLGVVNFVFAALATLLVDWAGRKKLLRS